MKFVLLIGLLINVGLSAFAQKKVIDSTVFDKWPSLQNPAISSDGKYVSYTIDKVPLGSHTLIVQSTTSQWKREIIGASDASFSAGGRSIIYKTRGDSICIDWLSVDKLEYIPSVQRYQFIKRGREEWLLLKMSNTHNELRFLNVETKIKKSFFYVSDYKVSGNAKVLLVQMDEQYGDLNKSSILWISLNNWDSQTIWQLETARKKSKAEGLQIDHNGTQAMFILTERVNEIPDPQLWYYKVGMKQSAAKITSQSKEIPKGCVLTSSKFSVDGSCIFVEFTKSTNTEQQTRGVMVDIWSYTDDKLQAQQLKEVSEPCYYMGAVNLENDSLIIMQKENERVYPSRFNTDDFALLATAPCYYQESKWRKTCQSSLYLLNMKTGGRQLIKDELVYTHVNSLSPNGNYVVFYDFEKTAYFSYDIKSGKLVNISEKIPFPIFDKAHARADLPAPFFGGAQAWFPDDKGLIVYDEYDIWQIDPQGKYSPVCLTRGYGRANKIILRYFGNDQLITSKQLLLTAFRPTDKYNGFFAIKLDKHSSPELLSMGPYIYNWPYVDGRSPIKSSNRDIWLVQRMTASNAPNYFTTKDFKSFQQLTSHQPQKEYNWLTAELHEWTMFNGKKSQGILYKPENFDATKKYPVIFHFYEEKSDELHRYLMPDVTGSRINIPHFVSNGYLVFIPDVYYTIGEPAEGIYNAVISAAHYVANKPFVDRTKMGMQGHSFGAYEVNVLITKTNIFAAAAEAAGPTDFISGYGSVLKAGNSNAFQYESGQNRIGTTLWNKPDLYMKNSPIFYADKVSTPLLMMHCKEDGAVPFEQAVEWFTALRRLNKKVWLLQYDNGGHQLGGMEALDYSIRLMQFFDHYLKEKPAPMWMIRGIPAKFKGIETGFEFLNNLNNPLSQKEIK